MNVSNGRIAGPALGLLAFLLVPVDASAAPPTRFPDVDEASMVPFVVVATVSPGGELPQFPECSLPDRVCLDPPPFWFNADIQIVVHGPAATGRIQVATTSHYGYGDLELYEGQPLLMLLWASGDTYVMRRYATAPIATSKRGDRYLPVLSTTPEWWLPCSAWQLQQPVSARDFPRSFRMSRKDAQWVLQDNPALFDVGLTGVSPRHAIPLADLGRHLDSLAPTPAQMSCGDG